MTNKVYKRNAGLPSNVLEAVHVLRNASTENISVRGILASSQVLELPAEVLKACAVIDNYESTVDNDTSVFEYIDNYDLYDGIEKIMNNVRYFNTLADKAEAANNALEFNRALTASLAIKATVTALGFEIEGLD